MKCLLKNHIIQWILGIELIWLVVFGFYLQSQQPVERSWKEQSLPWNTQEEVTLPKGIYDVEVTYTGTQESDGGGIRVYGNTGDERGIWCDTVSFRQGSETIAFTFWVNEKVVHGISFAVDDAQGSITVNGVKMKTSWNSSLYQMVCLFLKFFLLDVVVAGWCYREQLRKHSAVISGILGITLICSLGFFTRYLMMGHDAVFHMNRIEGLKDGLLAGNIPVRIQPNWNYGWGYAVSMMYGDLLLLFPSLMRICGFTLSTAWKTFHIMINFATAAIAFYSFYKMCGKKYLALLASLLYCTSFYRLACIYIRSAVGESAVMMFLPLVVLFFWYAWQDDTENENYGSNLLAPVIGFTGMIQTHVLTCEMAALFIVIFCVIMIRRLLRKKTLRYFLKAAFFTILINLWFLVPFLRMFQEDLVITQMQEMRNDFQIWGLSIAELFATKPSQAYYFTFGQNTSLANKCTLSIGTALWLGMAFSGLALWNKKLQSTKAAASCFCMGLLAAFMTTNLFPYSFMKEVTPFFAKVFSKIQFSYRFLGMATLFFVLTLFFAMNEWKKDDHLRKYLLIVGITIGTVAICQGMTYQYELLYGGTFSENKYSGTTLHSAEVISGEYLYRGTNLDVAKTDQTVIANEVQLNEVEREGLRFWITCKACGEDAYVEIPQFYYPGYVAYDGNGESYTVTRSTNNNRIHVNVPSYFEGTLEVFYQEPVLYRICEIISLITVILLLVYQYFGRSGGNHENNITKNTVD